MAPLKERPPTWLRGDEQDGVGAETRQVGDDPSVQVHIGLHDAHIRLVAAPRVSRHHYDPGAGGG